MAEAERELVWDPRLLEPARALELAGNAALFVTVDWAELAQFELEGGGPGQLDRGQLHLRCGACGRSLRLLGEGPPGQQVVRLSEITPYPFDPVSLVTSVLRHLVTHHDLPLNRKVEANGTGG